MKKAMVLTAMAALIGVVQGLATAQQDGKQDPQEVMQKFEEVTVYYAVVIGDGTIEGAARVVPIGPERRNKAEAEADEERWKKDHPKSLRLTDVREKTTKTPVGKVKDAREAVDKVKEAKEVVDKAKEIQEKGLMRVMAKERKLGDTFKELQSRIHKSFDEIQNLKSDMASTTKKLAKNQFDKVNGLIAEYNKSRDEIGRVERELSAARAERLKSAAKPGASGDTPKGGTPPQGNVSILEKFPPVAPLDPKDFKDKLEPEKPAGKWVVWVYKNVSGKWEKQEDRTLATDDQEKAQSYFEKISDYSGWMATSNLPKKEVGDSEWDGDYDTSGVTYAPVSIYFSKKGSHYSSNFFGEGTWSIEGNTISIRQQATADLPAQFCHTATFDIRGDKITLRSDYTPYDRGSDVRRMTLVRKKGVSAGSD